MKLRPYQQTAVDAVLKYFEHNHGNPIVALPTGTGKSLVIAELIRVAMAYSGQRVLVLTHVKELIRQNAEEAMRHVPHLFYGIVSAGLGHREYTRPITFAGIATAYRIPEKIGAQNLIIVDECHLIDDSRSSMYMTLFKAMRALNPAVKIVGLSATPYRLKQGMLTDGDLFDEIVCNYCAMAPFNSLVDAGYLAPLIPRAAVTNIDLTAIRTVAGDYKSDDLENAMDAKTQEATYEILTQGADRKKWLIFCAGIKHAEHVTAVLCFHGIDAVCVHSKISDEERDENIQRFRTGDARAIVNMGVLTTGFNCPAVDLIAVLRPTQSPGLWVQMLGRGTRPAPEKQNCLVLDFGRNTERLGPINDVTPPRKSGKDTGAPPPMKICPQCRVWLHTAVKQCDQCGYQYPSTEGALDTVASTAHLIKNALNSAPAWRKVDDVQYKIHTNKEGRRSLCVMYRCGLDMYREFVCIGYPGYAGDKARKWVTERFSGSVATLEEAVKTRFRIPTEIQIQKNAKWSNITGYRW